MRLLNRFRLGHQGLVGKSVLTCALVMWLAASSTSLAQDNQDGENLLDEAIQVKLEASSDRDYDKVADLCEEAIEAGLSDESLTAARQMWASACLEYARLHAQRVFTLPQDRRWQLLRQQALERLEKAIELNPEMAEAQLLIARFNLLPGGDREAAEAAIGKALENSGDNPGQQALAMVLRAQASEDPEQQLIDLDQALQYDPDNELALQLRGNLYLERDQTDAAIADFRKLAESQGNNPLTLLMLAEKLVTAEKFDEARKVVDQAIDVNPDIPAAYLIRGQINLAQEKDEAAVEDVSRAIELDPRNLEALRIRANALYSLKKYDDALADVEKILVFQPQSVNAIYLRSFIYAAMENYEPAIEDMQFLVAGIPDEPMFKNSLAMLYNSADKPRKAIRLYNELLEDDPDDRSALRGRGDARLSTGEHQLAVEDYERAMELDAEDDGVLNNLAWVLSTSPDDAVRDGKRAVELSLKAAELTDWQAAHILSTLAASYAETGDFENAVKWSEKSVELAEPGRQHDDLSKELETFKRGEPWRELETVDEEDEEGTGNAADKDAADKDEGRDKDEGDKDAADKDEGDKDEGDKDEGDKDEGDKDEGDKDEGDKDEGDKDAADKNEGDRDGLAGISLNLRQP